MTRYLIFVLLLIAGALYAMYFWVGVPRVFGPEILKATSPHFYGKPDAPLQKIFIKAFYFVPKNKTESAIPDWREILEENLKKLQAFHSLQFQNKSQITYEIYPEIVVGFLNNISYDTFSTQHGNPEGLRRVASELTGRGLFPKEETGQYNVALIMYEGVGASGSDNVAFVSRVFLSDQRYKFQSASILAHEFYHTLGMLDAYDIVTGMPFSQDIMGVGRSGPIEKTFIDSEVLKQMGF